MKRLFFTGCHLHLSYSALLRNFFVLGLLFIFLLNASSVHAQTTQEPDSVPTYYHVLVPTDENGDPVGDSYYVPSELVREIEKAANNRNSSLNDWSIISAKYVGAFSITQNLQADLSTAAINNPGLNNSGLSGSSG
ncbi:MAG: hypothetical protein ACRC2T_10585, partial [Thermoguttaceae bacterium]